MDITIVIILFLVLFGIVGAVIYTMKKDEQIEKEKLEKSKKEEEAYQKYKRDNNISDDANVCFCINIIRNNKPIDGKWKVFIWKDYNNIYICGTTLTEYINKITIPIDNIQFYTRKGEVKTITFTEGGDISIGNAVLGSIVGLIIGAIIGIFILGGISAFVGLLAGVFLAGKRKVTTINREEDNRKTYLNYLENDKTKQMLFSSSDYKILYELIPEKDMDYIENNKIIESENMKQVINNTNDIYKDIEKLAELKDKGILTDEEYNQKKQVLLDRI